MFQIAYSWLDISVDGYNCILFMLFSFRFVYNRERSDRKNKTTYYSSKPYKKYFHVLQ